MNRQNNWIRRLASWALCLCMIVMLFSGLGTASASEAVLMDGSYEGTGQGRNGDIVLRVSLQAQAITDIEVVSQNETPRFWEKAVALLSQIIAANSPEVDAISGATKSSEGIKAAVRDALAKADGSIPGSGTAEDPFVISAPAQRRANRNGQRPFGRCPFVAFGAFLTAGRFCPCRGEDPVYSFDWV